MACPSGRSSSRRSQRRSENSIRFSTSTPGTILQGRGKSSMLRNPIEGLGRKQQRQPTGATKRDRLSWLRRQPRLTSGGNANAVSTVFRYAGSEENPVRLANRDPGSIRLLAQEGQAKA